MSYVNEGLNALYPEIPPPELQGKLTPRSIMTLSSFEDTPFCKDLKQKFGEVTARYYKFSALSVYDWHRDVARKCGINFLLNDVVETTTLFRNNTDKISRLQFPVTKCVYKLYTPMLFNTNVDHCVINYSNHDRFILTVTFPNDVTFEIAKEFLTTYDSIN